MMLLLLGVTCVLLGVLGVTYAAGVVLLGVLGVTYAAHIFLAVAEDPGSACAALPSIVAPNSTKRRRPSKTY